MPYRILLDPQGGDSTGTPAPAPAPTPAIADPAEGFKHLLAKHQNDGIRVAEKLYGENYELRRDNAALKVRVPADNDVVLKGDDLKKWQKYQDLGDPAEVRKSLDLGKEAQATAARLARGESYRKAAEVAGYRPAVLQRLAETDNLEIVIGEVKGADGKAVPAALVKGEGDSTTPLSQYVDTHWSEFKPALGGGTADKPVNATPPRRPAAMAGLAATDPDEYARQKLQSTGIYKTAL